MNRSKSGITDEELLKYVGKPDPLIIECGAHDGRDTERFIKLFPKCRVMAFEPDKRPIYRSDPPGFRDRLGNHPQVDLFICALSDEDGTATLYRSSGSPNNSIQDWDHSSRLQKPTLHLEAHPWCTFPKDKQVEVPTAKLDSYVLPQQIVDLLWIDVQGGQIKLIRGGERVINQSRLVYIECHHKPMYDGEPTQSDLLKIFDLEFKVVCLYENYNFLFRNRRLL